MTLLSHFTDKEILGHKKGKQLARSHRAVSQLTQSGWLRSLTAWGRRTLHFINELLSTWKTKFQISMLIIIVTTWMFIKY